MGILQNIFWVAVVLGIMILVHEFGHYAAAKLLGVRVEVFSVGFGKRLVGFRKGDTDYRISALPLGGYVKMAGENPLDQRTGSREEFMSHPRWHRFVIAVAGPFMNVVLAIGLLTGVFMVHYEHPLFLDEPAKIGWVAEGSAAAKAGILPGDRIARIADIQNPTWEDVIPKTELSPNQPLNVAIQRGDQILDKTVIPVPTGPEEFGSIGWVPDQPVVITDITSDMPAAQAGMRNGDVILSLDGVTMHSVDEVVHYIRDVNQGKRVEVLAQRDGQTLNFQVTPVKSQIEGETQPVYRLGFRSAPVHVDRLPFSRALSKSLEQNRKYSVLIIELVEKMVRRQVSIRQMEGPIGIAKASGDAARQSGWTPLLLLMAAISLNLGIFNLFPIPILDGGLILLLLVEGIMGRDISWNVKERIYQAAFVFLVLFAAVVIYNDIVKQLPGLATRLP